MSLSRSLLFIFFALLVSVTEAAEIVENGVSVKALGMGNAYLTHGQGHDAVFYNPAGYAKMQGMQVRLIGLSAGLNGLEDMYEKYKELADQTDTDMAGVINQLYGEPLWGRTDLQMSLSLGSFIFGAFGRGNVGFNVVNPAFPQLQSTFFADYGAFVGWGTEVIKDYVDFGATVKRITRQGGDMRIGPADLAYLDSELLEEQFKRKGTGYGADLGLRLKLPTSWNPTLSAAWHNVGKTKFSIDTEGVPPPTLDNELHLGVGLEKDMTAFTFRWGLDFRHVDLNGEQIGKKVHTGIELDFPMLALRGGFSQGYYTAGASLDLWFFQLDAATYGVELGAYPGQMEDRRYIVQLTLEMGFDSAGNLINLKRGRHSRLKQRR